MPPLRPVRDADVPWIPHRRRSTPDPCRGADPDGDIVATIDRGDIRGATQQLMQRHGAAVYRYCREALRDAALADDVQQQVFIEAFRDLQRFGQRGTLRVWLFAIARHRVLDAAKHRRRIRDRIDDSARSEISDSRPSPAESLDDARLKEILVASLRELSETVRTAVLLRYQQGFTFDEMSVICREKRHTLYARVARALPVLRARIETRLCERTTGPARERPRSAAQFRELALSTS